MKRLPLVLISTATAAALSLAPAVHGSGLIFSDDFQSGNLAAQWQSASDKSLGGEGRAWTIASDPDFADGRSKALCTPPMGTQVYLYHLEKETIENTGSGLALSYRFNADFTNNEWNSTWNLFTAPILNGAYPAKGYSMRLWMEGDRKKPNLAVAICRVDAEGGKGDRIDIAKTSLAPEALRPGWNAVRLVWRSNGTLAASLNGVEVLSAQDGAYAPAFRTLHFAAWLSNNQPVPSWLPEGRKLYIDDVKVESAE